MQENKNNKRLSLGLWARIKQISYSQQHLRLLLAKHFRISLGVPLAVTLLLPLLWIPGLVILILPSEVYLLDWWYSQYKEVLAKKSLFDKSSESEYDFEEAERKRDVISRSRHLEFAR
ncbi:MAG: hypothetical protein ACFFCX_12235 [Candidatus Sifarchaeia archaeon]